MHNNEHHEPTHGNYSQEREKMVQEEQESSRLFEISNNLAAQGSFKPIQALKNFVKEALAKLF